MQHGWHSADSIAAGIRAIVIANKPAVVRVPVGDFAFASRALDMGAEAIIAPMINTVADAQAFVDATKYPPLGKRSWGPGRAMTLSGIGSGADYLAWTRDNVLAFAMIETVEAITNLDAILSVPGIDGVFVGPSDPVADALGGRYHRFAVANDPWRGRDDLGRRESQGQAHSHVRCQCRTREGDRG